MCERRTSLIARNIYSYEGGGGKGGGVAVNKQNSEGRIILGNPTQKHFFKLGQISKLTKNGLLTRAVFCPLTSSNYSWPLKKGQVYILIIVSPTVMLAQNSHHITNQNLFLLLVWFVAVTGCQPHFKFTSVLYMYGRRLFHF